MTPRQVLIDCDPGVDDALALMLAAASPELTLCAVTAVAGNRPLAQTAVNARRVLDLAGCAAVPVHAGCPRPIAAPAAARDAAGVHGENGLGGVVLPGDRGPEPGHGVEVLGARLWGAAPGSLTLIALGPLTNLALAEILRPGTLARAREVLVMGGAAYRAGNVTPHAEFNFHCDPVAAHAVLTAAGARVVVFGLDVTEQALMTPGWVAALAAADSHCARAAHAMLNGTAQREPLLHDACPVAYAIDPSLFTGEDRALSVDWHDGPTAGRLHAVRPAAAGDAGVGRLVTGADAPRLMSLVRERIAGLR